MKTVKELLMCWVLGTLPQAGHAKLLIDADTDRHDCIIYRSSRGSYNDVWQYMSTIPYHTNLEIFSKVVKPY